MTFHVWMTMYSRMWKLDHKEGWSLKNWYFWIVVLEKTLESLLGCKEIKPVHPKGNQPQPRVFIGMTDAEAEAPILWPPDGKSQLIGNYLDAGKDWGQEEKGATEDEMDGITDSKDMSLSKLQEIVKPGMLQSMGSQGVWHNWVTEQQPTCCSLSKYSLNTNHVPCTELVFLGVTDTGQVAHIDIRLQMQHQRSPCTW